MTGRTVLFVGDSITHALRRPDEVHDCYGLGCGYVNSAAAELSSADPTAGWHFVNRGECGDTLSDLARRWDADCLAAAPAVVSVLVGVNDATRTKADPIQFQAAYAALLDRTRRRLPDVRQVVLEPFGVAVPPHPTVDVITRGQLDRLAALQPAARAAATAAGAVFVPLQHLFDSAATTLDGVHPSAAGHWRIARAWTAAVRHAGWFPGEAR